MKDVIEVEETVPQTAASVPPAARSAGSITTERPPTIIQPGGRWPRIDLRELWEYRGLFFFLVWRDVKVRYSQTVLGAGWAILQPVLTMIIFSVIFGRFAGMPSDNVPYPVFSLTALVPWTYFSASLTASSQSLVTNSNLITKVYFPRLVVPMAPILAGLVDFGIGLVILLAVMLGYGYTPTLVSIAVLPLLVLVMMLVSAGAGCWLAALNVQYRDVKYVVPFLVQVLMWASPIAYPTSIIDEEWRLLYALNPLVGVFEGFRAVLLGSSAVSYGLIGGSLLVGLGVFVSGALYFRSTERLFADVA